MPDFTVIDGGGDRGRADRELSQQYFEDFVVALLRSLASGEHTYRITEQFFRFLEHAQESSVPIGQVFQVAIRDLNDRAIPFPDGFLRVEEKTEILLAALRVIAERASTDSLARARLSRRDHELQGAIERYTLDREERARANGWSYLKDLTKQFGKRPKNDPTLSL
jgi:hypothetical protein